MELLRREGLQEKFERWHAIVTQLHEGFISAANDVIEWTPLRKPLCECCVALVSTAGVHRRDQEPFDMQDPMGDHSRREIPGDVDVRDLMVTHDHYNHEDGDKDINCVFPIDRLREIAALGEIAEVSSLHFGLMGFAPNPSRLLAETAAIIGRGLLETGVDLVVLTPG